MPECFVIEGGRRLAGRVRNSTAKNSVLPMMAATILTSEQCVLHDVPDIRDVTVMSEILKTLGAEVRIERDPDCPGLRLSVRAAELTPHAESQRLMGLLRSSIFVMGALLARLGRATVRYPGGCSLGRRPINLHLQGLRALGANIAEQGDRVEAEGRSLAGRGIHLDFPSVGATENIMMAAVLAKGTTVIHNPAKEPEIVDLQGFLNSMGARVRGAGLDAIRIEGVRELGGTSYTPIPDRIVAGTLLIAGAVTGGRVEVSNVVPEHLSSLLAKLREVGAEVWEQDGTLGAAVRGRPAACRCRTQPYPGFPTDLQPPLMTLACIADGTSVIRETVHEQRFNQAQELERMGADLRTEGRTAIVRGVKRLYGTDVRVHDLRGGASLVLAGLVAEGRTTVGGIEHVDRGYERLEAMLSDLGAAIERRSV